ncbi:hypothetical protein ROZALSC1DRAFT_24408 [Rozella allomycis CSF55]|uniref:Ankyrin n=1 Tax=Rozella allomycis (strain CSF55) TaxID=988480 RepID=A0A4P9YFZ6_ROZAC|nr:hypothetical protein ROZALSC1DRAFT_24408 [Rozella allomycis CSF55]
MNWASQNGHLNVLEWWKNSGVELKWSEDAMDWAGRDVHIDVLDWWKKSGLELKWSEDAMDLASEYGHLNVLEWWKKSGLELKWSENAMNSASEYGHVKVLEWWKKSGLELKWSDDAIYEQRYRFNTEFLLIFYIYRTGWKEGVLPSTPLYWQPWLPTLNKFATRVATSMTGKEKSGTWKYFQKLEKTGHAKCLRCGHAAGELKRLQITIETSREAGQPQVITTLTASDQYSPVTSIWKKMFDVDTAVEKLKLMDESNELPEGWEYEDQDLEEDMDAAFDFDYEEDNE